MNTFFNTIKRFFTGDNVDKGSGTAIASLDEYPFDKPADPSMAKKLPDFDAPRTGSEMPSDEGLKGKTIVIGEDDLYNREAMKTYLETAWNMHVLDAETGEQALELLKGVDHVDWVVLDIDMPALNGIQTVAAIRSQNWPHQQVPVVMLTSHSDEKARNDALAAGANGFLVKTGNMKALKEKLVSVVAKKVC